MARSQRHRRLYARMIPLAPLLKPALQVEIGQSSQARNVPHALGVRAMTGITGHNVVFWNSIEIDCSSPGREILVAIIGGFRGDRRKIDCQITPCMRTQSRHGTPHILLRKWIVSRVLAITPKLALDVLRPLSGQSRRDHIALTRSSVAPGAIADAGAFPVTCPRGDGGGNNRQNRYFQPDALHDLKLSRLMH